jgi:putative ABC transport system substrate-binding protein
MRAGTDDRIDEGNSMNRREATIAVMVLAAAPLASEAQPRTGKSYRIGFLGVSSAAEYHENLNAFLQGLRDLGYEDGKSIAIEYRWAEGREERLVALAAELVRLQPDLLVSHSTGVGAVQQVTSTIPIVMGVSADPVGSGLINSLAKPGGNTTGVASRIVDLAAKRLELLKEAVPKLKSVAVLSNLALPAMRKSLGETEIAARKLGVRVRSFGVVADLASLERVFAAILRDRLEGLVVQPDPVTATHGPRIAAFAMKSRLPAIGGGRYFVVNGGLLSYGGSFAEGWRLAARYVDKILKGARPGDLPVEQPTKFELAINLNAAKEMGLALPSALLLRADEVIQ